MTKYERLIRAIERNDSKTACELIENADERVWNDNLPNGSTEYYAVFYDKDGECEGAFLFEIDKDGEIGYFL